MIQVEDNQFWIDPGPNALKNAAENSISVRATTALLVSHAHIGHSNDTNAVIDAMTYSGFDKKGVLIGSRSAINGTEELPAALQPRFRNFLERFIVLEAGQRVGINDVEILALKTIHSDPTAIGFKFFTPYFTLAYSSDTKYSPELVDEYKNSNILVLNLAHDKKEDARTNLCIEDAIKIIGEVKPRLAIVTHFGTEMVKGDPLSKTREIQMATGVQTITAKDGMVVNPLSYSVNLGQRILNFLKPEDKKEENKVEVKKPVDDPTILQSDKILSELLKDDAK